MYILCMLNWNYYWDKIRNCIRERQNRRKKNMNNGADKLDNSLMRFNKVM